MLEADGETAIEQAVLRAYPGAEPLRFAVPTPGKLALAGCLAVRLERPVPHWLVVSRGLTELGAKVDEDPEVSGWGFELTCRLPARTDEPDFGWMVDWMQNIADALADRVTCLEAHHHMPMWPATHEDEIAAVVFVDDVALGAARSQNGTFGFLQLVGLTTAEYEALESWDAAALVELIRARDPLLLMDTQRACYLGDPAFARAVEAGRERDGSSSGVLYGVALLWLVRDGRLEVHLDANAARAVRRSARARLAHGRPMALFGEARRTLRPDGSLALHSQVNVALRPEAGPSVIAEENGHKLAIIRLGPEAIAQLAVLLDEAPGTYVLPALERVCFVVTPAERLRDPGYRG